MTIYIKNMVCIRCKMAVQAVLEELEIPYQSIELGMVKLSRDIDSKEQEQLNTALKYYYLELMDDKKTILTERVKTLIVELLHEVNDEMHLKLSSYLSANLHYDYTYLSNTFSEIEGYTIEKFYIVNRIERVKELLLYENLNITEIAYQLNYSSVSHLCLQFKKITGLTPSAFKRLCESDNFVWRKL